ncbi:MAG: hypothetical protein ACF8Q5_01945 [Phycisphaerales bacterium JB040]
MTTAIEKKTEHIGETAGMADHDRDLVHELSRRLDCLWRCDQYIANAEGHKNLVEFWESVKAHEQETIDRMRSLIRGEIDDNCF